MKDHRRLFYTKYYTVGVQDLPPPIVGDFLLLTDIISKANICLILPNVGDLAELQI